MVRRYVQISEEQQQKLPTVEEFSKVIGLTCQAFSGQLYYHEMIGILELHKTKLATESNGDCNPEEDDDIPFFDS